MPKKSNRLIPILNHRPRIPAFLRRTRHLCLEACALPPYHRFFPLHDFESKIASRMFTPGLAWGQF